MSKYFFHTDDNFKGNNLYKKTIIQIISIKTIISTKQNI